MSCACDALEEGDSVAVPVVRLVSLDSTEGGPLDGDLNEDRNSSRSREGRREYLLRGILSMECLRDRSGNGKYSTSFVAFLFPLG